MEDFAVSAKGKGGGCVATLSPYIVPCLEPDNGSNVNARRFKRRGNDQESKVENARTRRKNPKEKTCVRLKSIIRTDSVGVRVSTWIQHYYVIISCSTSCRETAQKTRMSFLEDEASGNTDTGGDVPREGDTQEVTSAKESYENKEEHVEETWAPHEMGDGEALSPRRGSAGKKSKKSRDKEVAVQGRRGSFTDWCGGGDQAT